MKTIDKEKELKRISMLDIELDETVDRVVSKCMEIYNNNMR